MLARLKNNETSLNLCLNVNIKMSMSLGRGRGVRTRGGGRGGGIRGGGRGTCRETSIIIQDLQLVFMPLCREMSIKCIFSYIEGRRPKPKDTPEERAAKWGTAAHAAVTSSLLPAHPRYQDRPDFRGNYI